MKPKALFAVKALVISAVLFAVWSYFSGAYLAALNGAAGFLRHSFGLDKTAAFTDKSSYFLIPAIAMIWAASQASAKRKIVFTAGVLISLYAIDLLILMSGLKVIAEGGGRLADSAFVGAANILYHSYGWLVPLLAVFLFIGAVPERLWEKQARDKSKSKSRKAALAKR